MIPIKIRGVALNKNGYPLICTSLVAATADGLLAELRAVLPKRPDIVEWRVDFFSDIGDIAKIVATAHALKQAAGGTPIIFTRRAAHEGGQETNIAEESVFKIYEAVIVSGAIDVIDVELSQAANHRAQLRALSRQHNVAMILSYHNFKSTPSTPELVAKLLEAADQGADIAKIAVMPQSPADVLTLLSATLVASEQTKIPIITMSMAGLGAMTRLCGWMYGSALTFAVGESSSAPGQMPIEALRAAMVTMHSALGGDAK